MCNPLLIMAGASFVGGAMKANAEGAAADQEARTAQQNAMIADAQAEQAKQIGNIEEQRVLQSVRRTLGAQRAAFGASNVDASTGTPLDIQLETAGEGAADAAIARANAMRQAWGFEVDAKQSRERAAFAKQSGKMQRRATLLTSAANAYGTYKGVG